MPIVFYRTGIASLGMEETASAYMCDWLECESEADYGAYCDEHACLREQEEFEQGKDQPPEEDEPMENQEPIAAEAWFVLTHEYSDRSGFHVCGITQNAETAAVWSLANEDNYVYRMEPGRFTLPYEGHKRWQPDGKPDGKVFT